MKRAGIILLALAVLVTALLFAFLERRKEAATEMQGEAVVPETNVRRTGHQAIVGLDLSTQQRIGLATAPVVATNLTPLLHGFARVLDPAPLAALVAEIATAQAAVEASSNELTRAQTLFAQDQNVSARALEQAQAAARHDRVALDAAGAKLAVTFGSALAESRDLPLFVQELAAGRKALVRVELPLGAYLNPPPSTALLVPLAAAADPIPTELAGPAPTVSPETQGQAFLFVARQSSQHLAPGQTLTAQVAASRQAQAGVLVPAAAVLRAENRAWAYVQRAETNFVRCPLGLAEPLGGAWFVTNGVAAGERVVVSGAQTLLAEEFKASIPVSEE